MTLAQVRKLVRLAMAARTVCLLTEEVNQPAGPEALAVTCVTADGVDVQVSVVRQSSVAWLVGNGDGDRWSAQSIPDEIIHAIGEALGDKEEAA